MDGFLLVDKPEGLSSFAVVGRARARLGRIKGGHAGTLDPFATGLMVVLLGKGTRLMQYVVGHDKRYRVVVRLGATSDTDDATGMLTPRAGAIMPPTAAVEQAVAELAARTSQVPPQVSALHVEGERAYRRVRRGEQLELKARPVAFYSIDLLAYDPAAAEVELDVHCSTGTYMRSLARDLGELLGTGGHAEQLVRTAVGEWRLEDAVAIDDIEPRHVRPLAGLVPELPHVELPTRRELVSFLHGQRVTVPSGRVPDAAAPDEARDSAAGNLVAPGAMLAGALAHAPMAVMGPGSGMLAGIGCIEAVDEEHRTVTLRPRTVLASPSDVDPGTNVTNGSELAERRT